MPVRKKRDKLQAVSNIMCGSQYSGPQTQRIWPASQAKSLNFLQWLKSYLPTIQDCTNKR